MRTRAPETPSPVTEFTTVPRKLYVSASELFTDCPANACPANDGAANVCAATIVPKKPAPPAINITAIGILQNIARTARGRKDSLPAQHPLKKPSEPVQNSLKSLSNQDQRRRRATS